jgi:hypothetical protein
VTRAKAPAGLSDLAISKQASTRIGIVIPNDNDAGFRAWFGPMPPGARTFDRHLAAIRFVGVRYLDWVVTLLPDSRQATAPSPAFRADGMGCTAQ